jgi:hypothetical protein
MSRAPDQVAAGRAAWARLTEHGRRCWDGWVAVARALVIGRTAALKTAQTNSPVGSRYNAAMGVWLQANGLDGISNQERYRALLILENLDAISAWRDGLSEDRRRTLNHPGATWHAWRRATTSAATRPRQRVVTKKATTTRGYGRAVHWPQETLRRAARAVRACRSIDSIILARAVLESAIRNETDLLALLPSTTSRPQRAVAMSALPRAADFGCAAGQVR